MRNWEFTLLPQTRYDAIVFTLGMGICVSLLSRILGDVWLEVPLVLHLQAPHEEYPNRFFYLAPVFMLILWAMGRATYRVVREGLLRMPEWTRSTVSAALFVVILWNLGQGWGWTPGFSMGALSYVVGESRVTVSGGLGHSATALMLASILLGFVLWSRRFCSLKRAKGGLGTGYLRENRT